jgi:hypothetical protein
MTQTFREKHNLLKSQVIKKFNRLMTKHPKPILIDLGLQMFVLVNDRQHGTIIVKVVTIEQTTFDAIIMSENEIKQYDISALNSMLDYIILLEMISNI